MSYESLVANLRTAAGLIEATDLPYPPFITSSVTGSVKLHWFLFLDSTDHAVQKAAAALIVRGVGGKWDKGEGSEDFLFTQDRGGVICQVSVRREAVCERVVIGTEEVEVPAQPATESRTEQREVVEWRCESLFGEPVQR